MIRKSGYRFSLATNAKRVCAEIMLRQKLKSGMTIRRKVITLRPTASLDPHGEEARMRRLEPRGPGVHFSGRILRDACCASSSEAVNLCSRFALSFAG